MRRLLVVGGWIFLLVPPPAAGAEPVGVQISEIVADPQTDWNGDGRVTPSDEFVEVFNAGSGAVALDGWHLLLNDTTPAALELEGEVAPGGRRVWTNPPGELNQNAHVTLLDAAGRVADEIVYGSWPGNLDGIPAGDATDASNEALRRLDGRWNRGHATPGERPDRPFVTAGVPYPDVDGVRWAPPLGVATWWVNWTDADRPYDSARLEILAAGNVTATDSPVTASAGRWSAAATPPAPGVDFSARWRLSGSNDTRWDGPAVGVRIDRFPPEAPRVHAPAWTNATELRLEVEPAADVGVGDVRYALETRAGPEAEWVRATPETPATSLGPVAFGNASRLEVRALAWDGYGNPAVGPGTVIRVDRRPPGLLPGLAAAGYETLRVGWKPPPDDESGPAWVHVVRRGESGVRSWRVPPGDGSVHDEGLRLGEAVRYEAWVEDAAGNHGPVAVHAAEAEFHHPHARALRFSRSVWGPGVLRFHLDFDRPMDVNRTPAVWLDVADPPRLAEGTWLSNRTTYAVQLDSNEGWPEGDVHVRLESAFDARGRPLWRPLTRPIRVDASAPDLHWSDAGGWVGPSGLRLEAADSLDPAPVVRYRTGEAGSWAEAVGSVGLAVASETRVSAYAVDAAGHRAPERERRIRPDLDPPRIELLGPSPTGPAREARFRILDNGSGVDWARLLVVDGGGEKVSVEGPSTSGIVRWTVERPARTHVQAWDRVGNVAEAVLGAEPAADAPPGAEPSRGRTAAGSLTVAPRPPPRATGGSAGDSTEAFPAGLWTPTAASAAASLGSAALLVGILGTVSRARARRGGPPSLARRIQRHRRS